MRELLRLITNIEAIHIDKILFETKLKSIHLKLTTLTKLCMVSSVI